MWVPLGGELRCVVWREEASAAVVVAGALLLHSPLRAMDNKLNKAKLILNKY